MDFARLSVQIKFKSAEEFTAAMKEMGMSSDAASKKIKTLEDQSKKTDKSINTFNKNLHKFSGELQRFSRNVNRYVLLPLVGVGAAAIKASVDLNEGLANVATLIPGQTEELLGYKQAIRDLAGETGKSFDDLTRGLYEVISAFPGTREAIEITEIASKTAIAGLATTKQSMDLLSATTKAYGDTSAQAQQKVSDLAFAAVKFGQTTFLDVSQAIQKVTASSIDLGISQEELFAAFSTFTGVTGNAEMVATQLRSALISLLNPTVELRRMLEYMGYTGAQAGRQLIADEGLLGAFQKLQVEAEKLDLPIQKYMRRIEGITFATQLLGPLQTKFIEDMERMGNVAGNSDEAFREQTDGINKLGFSMKQLKMEVANLLSVLGDTLGPTVLEVVTNIKDFVSSLQDSEEWLKRSTVEIGLAALEWGIYLNVLNGVVKAFTAMKGSAVIGGLGKILGLSAGGIVGVGTLAVGAAVGLKLLADRAEVVRGNMVDAENAAEVFGMALQRMVESPLDDTIKYQQALDETAQSLGITRDEALSLLNTIDDPAFGYSSQLNTLTLIADKEKERMTYLEQSKKNMDDMRNAYTKMQDLYSRRGSALELFGAGRDLSGGGEDGDSLRSFLNNLKETTKIERDRIREIRSATEGYTYEDSLRDLIANYEAVRDEILRKFKATNEEMDQETIAYFNFVSKRLIAQQEELAKLTGTPPPIDTDEWQEALKEYVDEIDVLNRAVEIGFIDQTQYYDMVTKAIENLIETGLELNMPADRLQPWVEMMKNLNTEVEKTAESVAKLTDEQQIFANMATGTAGPIQTLINQSKERQDAIWAEIEALKLQGDATEDLKLKGIAFADEFMLQSVLMLAQAAATELTKAFTDLGYAMGAGTLEGDEFDKMMGRMLLSILQTISALLIQVGLQLVGLGAYTGNMAMIGTGLGLAGLGLAGTFTASYLDGMSQGESNAKGGVYGHASGGAFTNQIIDTPKYFGFNRGTGLMGEAGPEAIMPLTRTQDGNLGVRAVGGSTEVIVNIINNAGEAVVRKEERQTPRGKEIDVIIETKVNEILGNGRADKTMKSRYGVSPRGYR